MQGFYQQHAVNAIHEVDGLLEAEVVLENGVDRSRAPENEGEAHDANQGRHDHGNNSEVGKKAPGREVVTEQEKSDGDAKNRGGDDTGDAKHHGVEK